MYMVENSIIDSRGELCHNSAVCELFDERGTKALRSMFKV